MPLAVIQVAQAVYTIRLVPLGYASNDEARYIVAGHQLIYELWHGGGSPYYETSFSGAPDIYSPLAAMADHLGGLAEVRLMSMVFMLITTGFLFLAGSHLFGYLAGILSAALYAGLGMTQVVGRNAIYDALAFMLVAIAAYCGTRARDGSAGWLLAVPAVLSTAYFAKYMTVLFDPVVIGIASLGAMAWRNTVHRILVLGVTTGALLGVSTYLAGGAYLKGMLFTVFARQQGESVLLDAFPVSRHAIAMEAWTRMGWLLALAAAAVVLSASRRAQRHHTLLLLLLFVAGLLVTLEALHLGSDESTHRHDDLSAWFAAFAAGYALSTPGRATLNAFWRHVTVVGALSVALAAWVNYGQLPGTFIGQAGYDTGNLGAPSALRGPIRPYLTLPGGRFLLSGDQDYGLYYADRLSVPWYERTDDNYIKYPIPGRGGDWHGQMPGIACLTLHPGCMYLTGAAGFHAAIRAHAFAVVSVTRKLGLTLSTDFAIERTVERTPGYVLLTHIGGGSTWIYAPSYAHRGA